MNKLSEELTRLITTGNPTSEVNLHVMLHRDLKLDEFESLVNTLQQLATDPNQLKAFPLSGIVTLRGTLAAIQQIAGNPNVVWIDQDSEAPIEELLDG